MCAISFLKMPKKQFQKPEKKEDSDTDMDTNYHSSSGSGGEGMEVIQGLVAGGVDDGSGNGEYCI